MGGASFRTDAAQLTAGIEAVWPSTNPDSGHATSGEPIKKSEVTWAHTIHLSGLAAASRLQPDLYVPMFDRLLQSITPPPPRHRYFDNDARIGLALLEIFDVTHKDEYLNQALCVFKFLETGISPTLGGGVYWRESDKFSKHANTTTAVMLLAGRLHLATGEARFLETALALHEWCQRLKDSDQLLIDSMKLDGSVDRTKWTRCTAVMIQSALLLHRATQKPEFLIEAKVMAGAAVAHWVDPVSGAIHDEGGKAQHLVEALLDLAAVDASRPWRAIAETAVHFAQLNCQRNGMYSFRWDRYIMRDYDMMLYQASMERALWVCAWPSKDSQ